MLSHKAPQKAEPVQIVEVATTADPKVEFAIQLFDWISDSQNFELDHMNLPVFSLEKLRRELGVDKDAINNAISLLEEITVVGATYKEGNLRSREMRSLKREWLERGARERLVAILQPKAREPHVPYGAARVLRDTSVYVGRMILSFKAGDVVRDEAHIASLLVAGATIAKLDDEGARICANSKCQHRFDLSESEPLNYPILEATGRFQLRLGSVSAFFSAGDLIADRQRCLHITTGPMKDQLNELYREVASHEFLRCPKCHHVGRDQLAKSASQ